MAKKKPWWKKLQPGRILEKYVAPFVPGGKSVVSVVNRVESGIKSGAAKAAQAEAQERGVPTYQVAAEKLDTALMNQAQVADLKSTLGSPLVLIAGAAIVLFLLLRGRR